LVLICQDDGHLIGTSIKNPHDKAMAWLGYW
jgi:hypothetical protein